jgi:cell wall-associated NlpC family hydrolase
MKKSNTKKILTKKSKAWVVLPFIILGLIGCAAHHPQAPAAHIPPEQKNQTQDQHQPIENIPQNLTDKRQVIVGQAIGNLGQPYKWGGRSPGTGFDCSGLVFHTHGKAGIWVPRTTKALFKKGRSITKQGLKPGDLVFFNTPGKKTDLHVGIFIGKSQFIHAPGQGRRVRYASLENPYFKQHFSGARSFL